MGHHIEEVLVEVVQYQEGVTSVGLTSVEEEQWLEVFELSDGEVSTSGGLLTFFTEDTNTDVSLKDHTDIISTVTNGQGSLRWESLFDEINNISLLFG